MRKRGSAVFLLCSALASAASGQALYQIEDLGTLGGTTSTAVAATENGQVVGSSSLPGDTVIHAFLWLETARGSLPAGMNDLGTLSGDLESNAHDISANLHIVGASGVEGTEPQAFLWQNGVMSPLPTTSAEMTASRAFGVNDLGEAVGIEASADDCGGVLWLPAPNYGLPAGVHRLPTLPSHPYFTPLSINNLGEVVGYSNTSCGSSPLPFFSAPTLWLPTANYNRPAGTSSMVSSVGGGYSRQISDLGQIIGASTQENIPYPTAFLTGPGRSHIIFPPQGELLNLMHAGGVNASSEVVGWSDYPNLRTWHWANGVVTDLQSILPADSGWVLSQAWDIDNQGRIFGLGFHNTQARAFMMVPDWLFRDGFESGDTSAWNQAVP